MSYPPSPPGDNPPPPPPGGGGYPPQSGGSGGQPAPPTNQKALWSMILGIVSIVLCCSGISVALSVPAWIMGSSAKKEIAASQGGQGGDGMAKAGFILGIVGTVLGVLALLYWILVLAGLATIDWESYSTTTS